MRSPFGGGAFQSGGIADPEADDGGGSDDDSGGGGGSGGSSSGSVTRDRGGAGAGGGGETTAGLGSGDDDSGGGGSSDRRGAPTPEDDDLADTPTNIMVDPGPKGGATVGVTVGGDTDSSGSPGGATPAPSDSGGGSVGPSRQDRDDREATSPTIEGGDQRLFNEAAEQRRDRARSAAQSGGDQRLRNQATPNIEGGDQRLFTEERQLRREQEQFGDIPIENPLTGNRVEEDLQGLSDTFQDTAPDVIRRTATIGTPAAVGDVRTRDDPTAGVQGAVADAFVDTADPFGLALDAKEGVEFAADVVERVPARDATPQERLEALRSGELPESESRAAFVEDVQERTGTIARGARASPVETGLEVGTGLVTGTAAASGARRVARGARLPDVNLGLEQRRVRTFLDDDRGMANFPEQRTITRTAETDLDRLATEVDEMSLRDRARQRLPPREEFESEAAFQRELDALEQRLAERELAEIAEETDTGTTTRQADSDLDSRQTQQTTATQRPGRRRQREAEAEGTVGRDLDDLLTDVAVGTTAATGTQLDVKATQLAGQQTDLGAVLDLQAGTQVAEGIQTQLADDLMTDTVTTTDTTTATDTITTGATMTDATTTTGTTTMTDATTTTATQATRGDRGRPRPDLPEFDGVMADDDEREFDDRLGDTGIVNPVRSLAAVDEDIVDDLDTVGGQDAP